jgi:hypothetical protein
MCFRYNRAVLFLILIAAAVAYLALRPTAPLGETQFMLACFAGLGYVLGFVDSRLFGQRDAENRAKELAELE